MIRINQNTGRSTLSGHACSNKGFTLLEVLVVLVLVSLIGTVLMQGFGFVLGLQDRIKRQLVSVQYRDLEEQWFRSTVRAMHDGRKKTSPSSGFKGNSLMLSGLSLVSLGGSVGVPALVTWSIETAGEQSHLLYSEVGSDPVAISNWSSIRPTFSYLDQQGVFHAQWPPSQDELTLRLPKGVMLTENSDRAKVFWYVSISNNELPPFDASEWY